MSLCVAIGVFIDDWGFIMVSMPMILFSAFAFPVYKFARLEIFVQRRLMVRFDRLNRKVHVHRPRYAGGVVSLDWDKVIVDEGSKNAKYRSEGPLYLSWFPQDTPNHLVEFLVVGPSGRPQSEIAERWEFIRRFMENGPEGLPREKLIAKTPWPWSSITATLGAVSGMFKSEGQGFMMFVLPLGLFFAFWRWISLLLGWEPVFPRRIRKACGESFLSVLKAHCIDLYAWSVIAGLLWWIVPHLPVISELSLLYER